MNELKFNSQICTTREQSQRLLELGLKPETADMAWVCVTKEGLTQWVMTLNTPKNKPNIDIPAWSLHRLLELICNKECDKRYYFDLSVDYDSMEDAYDSIIEVIERHIKGNFFNKEYLKAMNEVSIIINGVRYDAINTGKNNHTCKSCELPITICESCGNLLNNNQVFKKSDKNKETIGKEDI